MRRVGFIGLGAMGLPMARNLARKQVSDLMVYDCNPVPMKSLADEYRIKTAESIQALGHVCDVVITMLPDVQTVCDVADGQRENSLLAAMQPGSVWVDMTTGDPLETKRLGCRAHQMGIGMVDAPVGRSPKHAERGDLLILAGGPATLVETLRPLFDAMATQVIYCGELGAGHTMKLVNNLLSGVIQEANLEALTLGIRAGLSVETMLTVFRQVSVWNGYIAGISKEDLSAPGWKTSTAYEHMQAVKKLADVYQVPVCCVDTMCQHMDELIRQGYGEMRYSSVRDLLHTISHFDLPENLENTGGKG